MKRFIIPLAAVMILTTAPAHGEPQIPREMQGKWCGSPLYPLAPLQSYYPGPCGVDDGVEMEITASGFNAAGNWQCTAIRVTKFNVPSYKGSSINPWGPGYRIKFRCNKREGGNTVVTEYVWQMEKDYLLTSLAKSPRGLAPSSPR
jgi:hypothetical protein